MIIHIDKEEVTILEIKIVTLGEKDTHAYNYRKDKKWIKFCREQLKVQWHRKMKLFEFKLINTVS